jgi:hypothetical protein
VDRGNNEIYEVPRAIQAGRVWVISTMLTCRSTIWRIQAIWYWCENQQNDVRHRQNKEHADSHDKNKLDSFK